MAINTSQRLSAVRRSIALASSLVALQLSLLMATAVGDDESTDPMTDGQGSSAPMSDDHGSTDPTSHDEGEHSSATGAVDPDGLTFQDPTWLAKMALVRVETGAIATVVIPRDNGSLDIQRVTVPEGPATSRTGFYVDPGSAAEQLPPYLITSTALSRESLEVWAINRAFQLRKGFSIHAHIDDMYARTEAVNTADTQLLNDCYNWRETSQCYVKTRLNRFVVPYTEDAKPIRITDHRQDELIQFFAYQCRDTCGQAPTIGISTELGEKWWVVGFTPAKPDPVSVQVTLDDGVTEDSESLLTPDEAAQVARRLGASAAGAPVISEQGYVIGLLVQHGDQWSVEPAHHLLQDAATRGVRTLQNQIAHHLRNGLADFESGNFQHAEGAYFNQETLEQTGHQTAVVQLAELVAAKAADDPDGDANSSPSTTTVDEGRAVWPWVAAVAVVAGAAALWIGVRHRKSVRGSGASRPSARPSVGSERRVPASAPPTAQPTSPGPSAAVGPDASDGDSVEHLSHAPQYCPSCGAQLSPGDRFCFSCGTPSR